MSGMAPYRAGGILRCCRALLNAKGLTAVEGDGLECQYCYAILRFRAGAWEWVNPSEPFFTQIERACREAREARVKDFPMLRGQQL